ncbi:MAG: hypothetical protein KAG97_12310, partial [Victivallales bacterium]|nr:hypothetical protein [Victivallales bacterium]
MVITRRLAILFASAFIFSVSAFGDESADSAAALRVDRILLKGEIIDDDNIAFKLSFKAKAENGGAIQLVSGSVCEKNSLVRFSSGFSLLWGGGDNFSIRSDKGSYSLKAEKAGECDVEFDFASKVLKKGVWRESSFALLPAISRDIEIFCGRKDVELEISGALQVVKKDAPDGKGVIFTAALPPEGDFKIKWRSHIERLDAKLIVSVEPAIISTVFPGTVRNFSVFDYKVIQGKLNELTLNVSPDLNVLKVSGEAIRDWRLEKDGDAR